MRHLLYKHGRCSRWALLQRWMRSERQRRTFLWLRAIGLWQKHQIASNSLCSAEGLDAVGGSRIPETALV